MQKKYVIDTNVLLEDENAITVLRNGSENEIYIPWMVLKEIDGLKKDSKLKHKVAATVRSLNENNEFIKILKKTNTNGDLSNDEKILEEINQSEIADLILVSNDEMLRFRASKLGIKSEPYKRSVPFQAESQKYSGFINLEEGEQYIANCFYWKDGKMFFNSNNGEKAITYEHSVWNVKPKTPYQNASLELMLDDNIFVTTIQSEAGFGKTYLALAAAFHLVLQEKNNGYKKIFVVKPNIEIGNSLGFLPGDIEEKMAPYFRPINDLVLKLHESREANKLFLDPKAATPEINTKKIEYLPINYLRGMNLEDCVIIVDEIQNLSRTEVRTVLSRMGENVKCFCLGDVHQIDNIHLNAENNGLNWMVKKFKGHKNYGHMVLKGTKSRGPIADMVRNCDL